MNFRLEIILIKLNFNYDTPVRKIILLKIEIIKFINIKSAYVDTLPKNNCIEYVINAFFSFYKLNYIRQKLKKKLKDTNGASLDK